MNKEDATILFFNLGINKQARKKIKDRRRVLNLLKTNKNNVGLKNQLNEINKEIKTDMKEEKGKNWNFIRKRPHDKHTPKESCKAIKHLLTKNPTNKITMTI